MGTTLMFKQFHCQVRGRGHEKSGAPCQDRTYYLSKVGVHVMALADGAGSAKHSEYGAELAVRKSCEYFVRNFSAIYGCEDGAKAKQDFLKFLLGELQNCVKKLNTKFECELKDLASTLLVVATFENGFIALHIGDGVIGCMKNDNQQVLSAPNNGEFANQTTFVTSSGALKDMRLIRGELDGITGFVLMSDGTESSLYNQQTNALAPACKKLIDKVASSPTYERRNPRYKKEITRLFSTIIKSRTSDDCSVGILGR